MNNRERSQEIAIEARRILRNANFYKTSATPLDLAKYLMANTGCSLSTAKRHIKAAIAGKQIGGNWGGSRGGGAPVGNKNAKRKEV